METKVRRRIDNELGKEKSGAEVERPYVMCCAMLKLQEDRLHNVHLTSPQHVQTLLVYVSHISENNI